MKLPLFLRKQKNISLPTEVAIVSAVVALFVSLAAATIGASSIWFDEAFGAYLIRFNFFEVFKFTGLDVHPPLYYWALQVWGLVFGTSDIALRSMSVFFGAIALVLGYVLLRAMFGKRVALVTVPLVAISPIFIRYAQEARMYTMVLAIGLAATYVLYLLQQKATRNRWALYGLLVALGMWTHYFTALIWLGHWAWRAIETRSKDTKRWRQAFFTKDWVLVHVWAVALFAPWLPWLVRQVLDVQTNGFWIAPISPTTLPAYFSTVFLYESVDAVSPWFTILLGVLVAAATYAVVATYKVLSRSERKNYRLLIASAVVPVALLIAMSLPPLQSTFMDRYLLTAAVVLVMVIGVALVRAPRKLRTVRLVIVALLLIGSIAGIANVYRYGNYNTFSGQKSQTKQLIAAIHDTPRTAGQPIIANAPWIYYEAAQYGDKSNGVYFVDKYVEYKFGSLEMLRQSDGGKITDLDAFLNQHPTVWYIGRPGDGQLDPIAGNVRMLQRIDISDPITKQPAYQAVQYQVTGE